MAIAAPRSNARLPVREQNRSGATWDAPASGSGVTRHEYRFKTDGGYPEMWEQIADSAPGGANEASYTVTTGLTGGAAHTFELRAVSAAGDGAAAEDGPVTRTVPTGPAAPTNFMATPAGDAQVKLAWDAPASDSGVTRHDYCFKTDGGYPEDWTRIANSAVGGTNQAGFTVPGLTNEVAHTFQLRAVSAAGNGAAAEAAPVTPTPGICDRTQQVQDDILGQLSGVSACAAVTVADLATVTALSYLEDTSITSLKAGDFAGLTAVTQILLGYNQLGALPANLFSGLTSLQELSLETSGVTSLPTDAFSGLTALTSLSLGANSSLGSLPENQFSELTKLHTLRLSSIGMTELPAGLFSGLSELREINLNGNGLTSLPVGVFSGLSKLEQLYLGANRLTSLPARLFSGLTALTTLDLSGNPTDPMPLTVTLEKVGTGQVRARVLAGAPSDLVLPVSVENGTLALGATGLRVSGGSVKNAKRVDRRKDLWEVTVKPGSLGDVTVTLEGGRACGTAGAVCTGDGRALSATISTTVLGPVALSVADARVREASDVTLDFAVTLSRASRAAVAVAYATADGSATAGSDYTATSGTLTFDRGRDGEDGLGADSGRRA